MKGKKIQYITDDRGRTTGVIVPIDLWQEIVAERETAYLLSSAKMKERLLNARKSRMGIDIEEARKELGI